MPLTAARASEEAFRPVTAVVAASASSAPAALNWRARGTASAPAPRQLPTAERSSAAEQAPAATSPIQPAALRAGEISSQSSRARLRDSVMQVNSYQDPAEAPPFGSQPERSTLSDPFESAPPARGQAPAQMPADTIPPDTLPPAMPNDDPPPPADELFRDQPIPAPRESFQLPREQREQLLDQGLSTEPGGPNCENQAEECQRAIQELQRRDITTITVGLLIEGVEGTDFPCDCQLGRDFDAPQFAGRNFAPTLFTWKAAGTCHKPLYFEDVQLERYGHSWNPVIQPFMSGAHFFVSVPLLPYKMGLRPPNECVYTLGYYRPGNCAPYMFEPIPLSLRAAVFQGFGTAAFAFWFWPPN